MAKSAKEVGALVPSIKVLLPDKIPPSKRATMVLIYAQSKAAIVQLKHIPHCREYEAKAAGLAGYARTMHDGEMVATARRVTCWAIRRCGELLKEEPAAKTGPKPKLSVGAHTQLSGRKALAKNHGLKNHEYVRAIRFAAIPIDAFTEIVEDQIHIPTLPALERLGKNELGRQARAAMGEALEEGHEDTVINKRYGVIYADPPWRYEHPPLGASSRSVENHYPTMTLEEICSLTVGTNRVPMHELAADDAMLFLWAPSPKLAECMEVITAWGFVYRTDWIWDKEKIGIGYIVRNRHETLLIAKRGELPAPAPKNRPPSVIGSRRGKHSVKPDIFRKWIARMYPKLDRMELFARERTKDWDVWGYEAKEAPNDDPQVRSNINRPKRRTVGNTQVQKSSRARKTRQSQSAATRSNQAVVS